jgi:hypothetical protein
MSKRLLQLTNGQLIKDLDKYKDQFIHFVLDNKSVRLLRVTKLEKKNLVCKDTKQHKIILDLSSVKEIWIETKSTTDQ